MVRREANKEVAKPKKSEFASVRLGMVLKKRLERLADAEGRSVSNLVRLMIIREVDRADALDAARAAVLGKPAPGVKTLLEIEIEAQEGLET